MKILQYALLACLLVSILGDDDDEENEGAAGSDDAGATPTALSKPAATSAEGNTAAKNSGGDIKQPKQELPEPSSKGQKKPRLPKRCLFKPEQGNCAGSRFLPRWWYNPETESCEPFTYPVCNKKNEAFVSCTLCMNMCMRNKRGREKAKWIRKVCRKSPKVKSG
uniref:Anticoagulant protein rhipilin-1 n=1 Tax=Rhipicephalus haemaphysaloides TaxID=237073 RepID=KUN1_RHIHE|nr:RecName: Full=Anticoagulant protein rhipilin-1; Flags: Precursor [Rhipicephalus haemaphysaloides]ADJ56344.1 anticoagulant protein rhipilin-1 [Rhipicephalus haemaphysaloides]